MLHIVFILVALSVARSMFTMVTASAHLHLLVALRGRSSPCCCAGSGAEQP